MIKNLKIEESLDVMSKHYIGKLGYIFGNWPFTLPITYYHDPEEKCIISYSAEGHKMHAMRTFGNVSLQIDEITAIHKWKSVLVLGRFKEMTGSSAKQDLHRFANGVRKLLAENGDEAPKFIKDFSSKLTDRGTPLVYRISITDIIGKYRDEA